jgi:hypothetical protein
MISCRKVKSDRNEIISVFINLYVPERIRTSDLQFRKLYDMSSICQRIVITVIEEVCMTDSVTLSPTALNLLTYIHYFAE